MADTVIVLGAGATKSCKGPLTDEILRDVFANKAHLPNSPALDDLELFLLQHFHVATGAPKEAYPGLPLLMSLIDMAIERRQAFHPDWTLDRMTRLRHAIEIAIFSLLELQLGPAPTNNHWTLIQRQYPAPWQPRVISLNYDLVIDSAVMFYSESAAGDAEGRLPDYGCDISTEFYRANPERYGTILKLHGSLNWLYCGTCHRLEIGASESRKYTKIIGRLLGSARNLEAFYSAGNAGSPCETCGTPLRALLVAPSHLKDYRNPHLTNVWYRAERLLRESERALFIGYSLPDDDVEVVYLLKRGLAHLAPDKITVVEYDEKNPLVPLGQHPTGRRYRTLFGDGIRWFAGGLDAWLAQPVH